MTDDVRDPTHLRTSLWLGATLPTVTLVPRLMLGLVGRHSLAARLEVDEDAVAPPRATARTVTR